MERTVTKQPTSGTTEPSPPPKYTPHKILMLMTKQVTEKMEVAFKEHPEGMSLVQFASKSLEYMEVPASEQLEFMECLCDIFIACDQNNNALLEWDELTDYMIGSSTRGVEGETKDAMGAELVNTEARHDA